MGSFYGILVVVAAILIALLLLLRDGEGLSMPLLFFPSSSSIIGGIEESPCECLTGIFADEAITGALHRGNLFIGIHLRTTHEDASTFFDPWRVKYANCLSIHTLQPFPTTPPTLENNNNNKAEEEEEVISPVEMFRRRLEEDMLHEGNNNNDNNNNNNNNNNGWYVRSGGVRASHRWRHREPHASPASIPPSPSLTPHPVPPPRCHLWLLPPTPHLPAAVWGALKELLQEGTLAGRPVVREIGGIREIRGQGVLLWADPGERGEVMGVVPPRTVMMFTTVRQ